MNCIHGARPRHQRGQGMTACLMEPDPDITFRILSMPLHLLVDYGVDELELTATYATTDRSAFRSFPYSPIDQIPVLGPQDEYREVPDPLPQEEEDKPAPR
jgi:hypothetical protein